MYIHCIYMYNVYLGQDVNSSKILCVIITSQLLTDYSYQLQDYCCGGSKDGKCCLATDDNSVKVCTCTCSCVMQ